MAVVGNCQARPIAQVLPKLDSEVEVITVAIVHLLNSDQAGEYEPYFAEADLIISQQIADNYRCDFVRTKELREKYGEKLVTIINLYYQGYNPELMYIRDGPTGTLASPLFEYHNRTIFDSWKEGCSQAETESRHVSLEYNKEKYSAIITASLSELKRREQGADIQVTDLIEERMQKERLFFSFNHPNMGLLTSMCERILIKAGREPNTLKHANPMIEALDKIIVPTNVYASSVLGLTFEDVGTYKGVRCQVKTDGQIVRSNTHYYSLAELVGKFFEVYDKNFKG